MFSSRSFPFFNMRQIDVRKLKAQFLGWQCRIRQLAAREFGGQPMPATRPRVTARTGTVIMPAMVVLLVPIEPAESTAFFKFQVQKFIEPVEVREAALSYLAADYFQLPELFSDEMTAVFGPASPTAARLLRSKVAILEFEQYSQRFRMLCRTRRIGVKEPARESSFWQARLFNANLPKNADVLGFKPDWKSAMADAMP
jgi:hypothetical protein